VRVAVRLLVLSSWFPNPPVNGSKLRAWHLLQELARRHEISLLSFAERDEAAPADLAALATLCADVRVVPGNPHKPEKPLDWRGYFGEMPRSYAQTFSPIMLAHAAAGAARAEAVIAFQVGTALYLNSHIQVPTIFDEAEVTTIRDGVSSGPAGAIQRWRRRLTWRKYAAFTKQLVAASSRTTVVSDVERAALGEAGCDLSRVDVLPNGVAGEYLDISENKLPDSLIYSGSMTYGPNLDAVSFFVSDIYPRIREVRPHVSFTVTGGHAGVPLEPLAREGVVFTGFVEQIARHVARSTISVVPLRRGGGTRLKILEAMALGTPVVATSKGAEGLEVRHEEHLLLADDAESFARCVVDLLDDPARASRLAANARRLIAERYTWHRIGQGLEQILQDAVETERRKRGSGAA
jgi:polysaccharide biosynthesis protein PslH